MKFLVIALVSAVAIVAKSYDSILRTLSCTLYALICHLTNDWGSKAIHGTSCASVKTISNSTITAGETIVEVAELSCGSSLTKRQTNIANAFGDVCACTFYCRCLAVLPTMI